VRYRAPSIFGGRTSAATRAHLDPGAGEPAVLDASGQRTARAFIPRIRRFPRWTSSAGGRRIQPGNPILAGGCASRVQARRWQALRIVKETLLLTEQAIPELGPLQAAPRRSSTKGSKFLITRSFLILRGAAALQAQGRTRAFRNQHNGVMAPEAESGLGRSARPERCGPSSFWRTSWLEASAVCSQVRGRCGSPGG